MFDLLVRLIRVNLYVRFFVRFHVRFFARYFCPTCSCPIFFWFFDPISCPIFARFLSDFLCPIFLSEIFVRLVHVRFSLTDSFILFLSDLFYPTCLWRVFLSYFLCPIFARFDVSSFCPIFCPLFWPICCHIFCVISLQKRWNMSRHVMPPLSCTINVLVFLLLWQYRIHVWVWYSSSHQWLRTWPWDSKEQP